MAPTDRDLVAALRAELAAIAPARACDRAAEAAGLAGASPGRLVAVARLSHRLGRAAERPATAEFDWDGAADHCRIAWLRGLFLAHGSLSVAAARTHLEFVLGVDEAPRLADRLTAIELPASWRVRRGRGVVTWKSTETVGTFLRLIGGGPTLLELEARQVARWVRGDLNRVLNAESANLQRAVAAAGRQLAAIGQLEAEGRLGDQPYVVRLVAEARRETPEATLTELAERLDLTRSTAQRALERIEWLAVQPDDGERPGPRRWGRVGQSSGRPAGRPSGRSPGRQTRTATRV
jgi:hypothetical protein